MIPVVSFVHSDVFTHHRNEANTRAGELWQPRWKTLGTGTWSLACRAYGAELVAIRNLIIQVMETEGRGRESERDGRVAVGVDGGATDSVTSSLRITTSTSSRCRSPCHAQRSLGPLHSFSFSLLFIRLFLLSFFRVNYDVNAMHHSLYGVYILLPAWQQLAEHV